MGGEELEETERVVEAYLVLCSCSPIRDARWVRDAFLQPVGAEGPEHDAGGTEEGADCPEGGHCCLLRGVACYVCLIVYGQMVG
jgi:hypothetical protein